MMEYCHGALSCHVDYFCRYLLYHLLGQVYILYCKSKIFFTKSKLFIYIMIKVLLNIVFKTSAYKNKKQALEFQVIVSVLEDSGGCTCSAQLVGSLLLSSNVYSSNPHV